MRPLARNVEPSSFVLTTAPRPPPTDFSNVGNLRQDLPVWYKKQQYPILVVNWICGERARALREWFARVFFAGVSEEAF
jgi:hypothetical protein